MALAQGPRARLPSLFRGGERSRLAGNRSLPDHVRDAALRARRRLLVYPRLHAQPALRDLCTFTDSDHARLAASLRSIKGRFLLSYNDHPLIRRLYRGCRIRKVNVQYTISRCKGTDRSNELLIANYPLPRRITVGGKAA